MMQTMRLIKDELSGDYDQKKQVQDNWGANESQRELMNLAIWIPRTKSQCQASGTWELSEGACIRLWSTTSEKINAPGLLGTSYILSTYLA